MTALSEQEFHAVAQQVSNWGRWGQDDQDGTLRFITPEKRKAAAGLVSEGLTISCAQDLNLTPRPDAVRPSIALPYWGSDLLHQAGLELLAIEAHGYCVTHLDALSHLNYRGRMYNDHPVEPYISPGLEMLDVMNCRDGIISRGVLIDVARARGKDWMDPAEIASKADVERALEEANLELESGDVLVFRTGRQARDAALGVPEPAEGLAGISIECASWFHDAEIAAMISDVGMDPQPSEVENVRIPWHVVTLAMMGMMIIDNAHLEELAETCARLKRWEFQLLVAPLRVPTGNSSPVNPIAIF